MSSLQAAVSSLLRALPPRPASGRCRLGAWPRPRRKSVNSPPGPRKARSQATTSSRTRQRRVRPVARAGCRRLWLGRHDAICPALPASGQKKTPRQGRGVCHAVPPCFAGLPARSMCPVTMGRGRLRGAWRLHRPARERILRRATPAVLSRGRRPCRRAGGYSSPSSPSLSMSSAVYQGMDAIDGRDPTILYCGAENGRRARLAR